MRRQKQELSQMLLLLLLRKSRSSNRYKLVCLGVMLETIVDLQSLCKPRMYRRQLTDYLEPE